MSCVAVAMPLDALRQAQLAAPPDLRRASAVYETLSVPKLAAYRARDPAGQSSSQQG
jgi:hypothetical protein